MCESHFVKKDVIIEKNLEDHAVPILNLSDKAIKLKSRCCGVCLEEVIQDQILSRKHRETFREISEFQPVTDLICPICQIALDRYIEFKTNIYQRHEKVLRDASKAPTKWKMSAQSFSIQSWSENFNRESKQNEETSTEELDTVSTKNRSEVEIGEECITENGIITIKEEPTEIESVIEDQIVKIKEENIEVEEEQLSESSVGKNLPNSLKIASTSSQNPILSKNLLQSSIRIKGLNAKNFIPLQTKPIIIKTSPNLLNAVKTENSTTNSSPIIIKNISSGNSIPIRIKSINGSFVSMELKNSKTITPSKTLKIANVQQSFSVPIQKISNIPQNISTANEETSIAKTPTKHTKMKITPLRPVGDAKENCLNQEEEIQKNIRNFIKTIENDPDSPKPNQLTSLLKEKTKLLENEPETSLAKKILSGRLQKNELPKKVLDDTPQITIDQPQTLKKSFDTLSDPQPSATVLKEPQKPPNIPKKARRKTPHESRDNPIKCPECKILFTSIESFLNHRDIEHPEKAEINALIRKQLKKTKCDHCNAIIVEAKMSDHVKMFHTTECEICLMKFNSLVSLDKHMAMVHLDEKESTCDICGEICTSKNEIEKHMEKFHLS